ncbi:hypothetical protein QOZ80_6AG0524010 [Eleusine coracana subsp. coracana]|nr:hypothetical protein QOZ80_6AG0524010 [Eleusine coracana subsp. coracana]
MMWIRLYDLPPVMMNKDAAERLGEQIGRVIKVDLQYPSYLRIRVDFALEKCLVPERECPEDSNDGHGIRFGEELRASPSRRVRMISVRPAVPQAARNLNFAGLQKAKVQAMSSSSRQPGKGIKDAKPAAPKADMGGSEEAGKVEVKVPPEISNELARGVESMQMDGLPLAVTEEQRNLSKQERLSLGSNITSDDDSSEDTSMLAEIAATQKVVDRLQARRQATKNTNTAETKQPLKVAATGRDIEKAKMGKTAIKAHIQKSIKSLMQHGLGEVATMANVKTEQEETLEETPAKKLKAASTTVDPSNLTGAHDEPRQEQ